MNIPKYWAQSDQPVPVKCWHWSEISVEDARRQANVRALEASRKFLAGQPPNRYGYAERPLREEIVQTLGDGGDEAAMITRNAYGALILNTARIMFIDMDFANGGTIAALGGLFRRLLGKPAVETPEQRCLRQIQAFAAQHSHLGFRVYRTCAGLRCLVTNQLFDPTEDESTALLSDIGSDPLYVRLCKAQACFRARLLPKPWRCGLPLPPERYPWASSAHESRFRQWLMNYERGIAGYAVCRLLQHIGSANTRPEIQPIIALHDKFTCGHATASLA